MNFIYMKKKRVFLCFLYIAIYWITKYYLEFCSEKYAKSLFNHWNVLIVVHRQEIFAKV